MPVRHARSETRGCPPFGRRRWSWQERCDKIPQRNWKQRGGHTGSRYLAGEDQASEVLLHALRKNRDASWNRIGEFLSMIDHLAARSLGRNICEHQHP